MHILIVTFYTLSDFHIVSNVEISLLEQLLISICSGIVLLMFTTSILEAAVSHIYACSGIWTTAFLIIDH